MKIKPTKFVLTSLLLSVAMSSAFAASINHIRLPVPGVNAPPVTPGTVVPGPGGGTTTPPVVVTPPAEPATDLAVADREVGEYGKSATYAPAAAVGDYFYPSFSVKNNGTKSFTLDISKLSITGPDSADVWLNPDDDYDRNCVNNPTIKADGECILNLYYSVGVAGAASRVVKLNDIQINLYSNAAVPTIGTASLAFRGVDQRNVVPGAVNGHVTDYAILTNTGDTRVSFRSATTGATDDWQVITNYMNVTNRECMGFLEPGAFCHIPLGVWKPATVRAYTGTLSVVYGNGNASLTKTLTIPLSSVIGN